MKVLQYLKFLAFMTTNWWCSHSAALCLSYQPMFYPLSIRISPKVLELHELLQCTAIHLQRTSTCILKRHYNLVFLVLNFILAWLYALATWSSACWRPCLKHQSVCKKQRVDPAASNCDNFVVAKMYLHNQ